jgi:hypothetical protein
MDTNINDDVEYAKDVCGVYEEEFIFHLTEQISTECSVESTPPDIIGTNEATKPIAPPAAAQQLHTERPPAAPQPGSVNANGEIYDRVFGWIKPSTTETIDVDSKGDINKMVGTMG